MRSSGDETASLVAGRSPPGSPPPPTDPWHSGSASQAASRQHGSFSHTFVAGPPDYAAVYFYKANATQRALYLLASVATLGALPVVTVIWLPQWYTRLTKQQVASVEDADHVLVRAGAAELGADWDERVLYPSLLGTTYGKWFEYRKHRHVYDAKKQTFTKLKSELREAHSDVDKRLKTGLTSARTDELRDVFGLNEIAIAPLPWQHVLLRKVLHPFYLFQVASALIWLSERYTTYALIIIAMSALSIAWEVASQVSSDRKLHELVRVDASVKVVRDDHVSSIAVAKLVVGDVVVIEEGLVPADIVLLTGECTADESTLTGEAIPITKQHIVGSSALTIDASLKTKAKESVLFAGSTVLAAKADQASRGVVLATGFDTSKGELFRAILYPKPINFKIERDSYRFLAALSFVALIAFIKRLVQASSRESGVSTADAIVSALDLVTIAVPPALPLILTIGVGFALTRLEAAEIFCINSQRINLAGHLDCFCFDKTGTLSSDHLDFQGVDEVSTTTATFVGLQSEVDVLSITSIVGLATCHGLIERSGAITGYALERDMFRATGYSIEMNVHKQATPNAPFSVLISSPIGKTFGVVKRYLFDAALQRSSVLIEDFETGQRVVYTKGAPEAVQAICNAATIPPNYMAKVRAYSYQGYYVVALASKTYPVTADVPVREAMECRLAFLGFALFLNKIKAESPYVISSLEDASVDVRIITGDNAFTAIHVARKVNMELPATVLLLDVAEPPSGSSTSHLSASGQAAAAAPSVVFADVDDLASRPDPEWSPLESKTFLGLADHNAFALTGAALDALIATESSVFVEHVVLHAKVFARIRPHQKTWLVETLIGRGKCVGMVGDGTNDCGALKAAHVGLALSDADASIVAPFTSRQKSITDVLTLVREGRCALSTSFVAFKFMVLYSLTQLTMASLMNDAASQMSNNQFLFDDLVVVFGLSVLMVRTRASEQLTRDLPAASLFAPTIVVSLAGQLLCLFVCLGIAISAARSKSWFCAAEDARELTRLHRLNSSVVIEPPCYVFAPGEPADLTQHSYENSVVWLFGHLQYWIVAVAFNVQDSYRKPLYANKLFVTYLAVLFIVLQVQLFRYKSEQTTETVGVDTTFGVLALPKSFCASLFFLFLFDLLLALVWELVVVGVVLRRLQPAAGSGSSRHGRSWFSASSSSAQSVSPYQADREGLLGSFGKSKRDVEQGRRKTHPKDNDDDDDEEEDVLTQQQAPEIVYVEYNSS